MDESGFTKARDVTKRITVSCRQASVLFSAILKAKGIPCRSRAGFMDFGNTGDSYMEHWVNEYWDFNECRWVLADVDGYYEYEQRFGYSQFDLPRRKFVTASEAWLGLRKNTLKKKLDVFSPNPLEGVCEYLFMDFHALLNNEIFYSYQPLYLRGGVRKLNENELRELDYLAELLTDPDGNIGSFFFLLDSAGYLKLQALPGHSQVILPACSFVWIYSNVSKSIKLFVSNHLYIRTGFSNDYPATLLSKSTIFLCSFSLSLTIQSGSFGYVSATQRISLAYEYKLQNLCISINFSE